MATCFTSVWFPFLPAIFIHLCLFVTDDSHLFSTKSEILLVAEYKENKHLFDDELHRADEVYRMILSKMHAEGYGHLTISDLSQRMGYLASQFRLKFDKVLNSTGSSSDALRWVHYDAFSQMYDGSVTLEPKKIRSYGSSFSSHVCPPLNTNAPAQEVKSKKFLKTSPSDSWEEKKQQAKDMIGQFTRFNNIMEQTLQKK